MKNKAKERLEKFQELFSKTTKPQSINVIAEQINFAINDILWLMAENPDADPILQFQIHSFMRRCFRNALRIALNDCTHYLYADDLAKRAGFHQYKYGNIVSIFDCVEIEKDEE